ncbi:MAG: quinolinate synthase NadA [Bacillota bacterium]
MHEHVFERITLAKKALGDSVTILSHHYQKDEVVAHADFVGDSFLLSKRVAEESCSPNIVFCGVRFMAETADILTRGERCVILPDEEAGCSLADMATGKELEECWEYLLKMDLEPVPVAYVNSSAEVKAFCGRYGGATCTSSNAQQVFRWALSQGDSILFLPDEQLGRNTAAKVGFAAEQVASWSRQEKRVLSAARPRLIVWDGHCSVHTEFKVEHVMQARREYPGAMVVVHPECRREVVDLADDVGSTEHLIRLVTSAPAGSAWVVGTEIHLVQRLARQNPDKAVFCLDPDARPCPGMDRISASSLLSALEALVRGNPEGVIRVDGEIAEFARLALRRMLDIRRP